MADSKQLSYTSVPKVTPYMYQTLPERLRHLADVDPDREAFIFYNVDKQRHSLTRKQFLDQATQAANKLAKIGIKKGTTVALCMNNSLEMLVMNMGIVMAGGVPFYLLTQLKDGSDLVEFINNLKGELLIMDTEVDDDNWKILEHIWPSESICSEKIPSLKMVLCNGKNVQETQTRKKLTSFLEGNEENDIQLPILQPEDTLAYFCSSGSTGKPKEIICTHYGILNGTQMCSIRLQITEQSVYFCDRTFSWILGYPREYFTEGNTRVFVDTRMSVAGMNTEYMCSIIEREHCDVVYLPGYMAVDVISNPSLCTYFKHVKAVLMSGERITLAKFSALKDGFCKKVISTYGNTECGGVSVFRSDESDSFEDGMIGKPIQGTEMKIVDTAGSVVPIGIHGELCVRSTWKFAGYRDMRDLFREVVDDQGWFHTGDIAHIRADYHAVVDGRMNEIIIRGTTKYFPWIIEKTLKGIHGAQNVFAVGVPDPRLNQAICACVLPNPDATLTEADVKAFCDESFLEESTAFGVNVKPQYYLIIAKVPLTRSGKIDRRTIALQAKEKLGL